MDTKRQLLCTMAEKHRDRMFAAERYIWAHAETGYREWETSRYMESAFEELGYTLVRAGNIPGFYTDLDTGREGPAVLIMAELDSLINTAHPECRKDTGAVHCCGHNAQCAALLGIAATLKEPGALEGMCGKVRLMCVPAEELIELEYREGLRRQGIIKYFGGKVEFMYRGFMDGIDIAFMVHTGSMEEADFGSEAGCNGCVAKNIAYVGKSAHAGGSPEKGINALYAANLGMQAINSIRETFRDDDHIRVHPIINSGCGAVNAIPERVTVESYVRGKTMGAIKDANVRVNRALAGAALAMGANVELEDRPGYHPLINDANLMDLYEECAVDIAGEKRVSVERDLWGTGCTDMGDISSVIPAIHPHCAGSSGAGHSASYYITDPEKAAVGSAKVQLLLLDALLRDGAAKAKYIKENSSTVYKTMDEYFKAVDGVYLDARAVEYTDAGAVVTFK